jgi:hypothetical protein
VHVETVIALVGLAATVVAIKTTGRRPTPRRAMLSVLAAFVLMVFEASLLVCNCHQSASPWSGWAVLWACFALVLAAVGRPWLRRGLACALVLASLAVL